MSPAVIHEFSDPRLCKTCRLELPLSSFYERKNRNGSRRVYTSCKGCTLNSHRKRWNTDEYRRAHSQYQLSCRSSESNRGYILIRDRRNARAASVRHPEKTEARRLVAMAIKSGKISVPQKCSSCLKVPEPCRDGRRSIQAHHHMGYSDPFLFVWLCIPCHALQHRLERALAHKEKP